MLKLGDDRLSGVLAIVVSNFLLYFCLFILKLSSSISEAVLILSVGNLISSAFAFVASWFSQNGRAGYGLRSLSFVGIWALSYISIYFIFLKFGHSLEASHIVIAESLVPFLVAAVFHFHFEKKKHEFDVLKIFLAVFILVGIATLRWKGHAGVISGLQYGLLGVVSFLFVASQLSARFLAKERGSKDSMQAFFSLFCAMGFFIWLLFGSSFRSEIRPEALLLAFLFGLLNFLTPRFFLAGLERVSSMESALWIGTSVPISVALDSLVQSLSVSRGAPVALSWGSFAVALLYCGVVSFKVR